MTTQSRSVCRIFARHSTGQQTASNGVFISPDQVMTALHCLSSMKTGDILFENTYGERTSYLPKAEGGRILVDRAHDLAVITLKKPVGRHFSLPVDSMPATAVKDFRLHTRHIQDAPENFRVCSTPFTNSAEGIRTLIETTDGEYKGAVFLSEKQLRHGHSGSPILDEHGRLVTVVMGNAMPHSQQILQEGIQRASGLAFDFLAVPPGAVQRLIAQLDDVEPAVVTGAQRTCKP